MWISVVVIMVVVTAALVVRNQLRVASNRDARQATVSRAAQAWSELFAEIQPVHVTNCDLKRFGEPHDGGYPLKTAGRSTRWRISLRPTATRTRRW